MKTSAEVSNKRVHQGEVVREVERPSLRIVKHDYKDRFADLHQKGYSGKRLIDITLGLAAFAVYSFLFPFIALGIKLSSPGKVIYRQKRTGLFGETFTCYKFRTMHQVKKKAENGRPIVTNKGDRRIFAFGQFLRSTNLDELPQVVNVLEGHMSLVGPRPYPVDECRYWAETFDDHFYRYTMHPGLTGLAQANGYRGGTLEVPMMRKRLDHDLIYTEKTNLWFDIKILFLTVHRMATRRTNGH